MKVFKFGGGILDSAAAIKQLPGILQRYAGDNILVVVSAFGKTTNALEAVIRAKYRNDSDFAQLIEVFTRFHDGISNELFPLTGHPFHAEYRQWLEKLAGDLSAEMPSQFDEFYDRIIGYGEMLSSVIVCYFLKDTGIQCQWEDIRQVLRTDSVFRDASVDWSASQASADERLRPILTGGDRKIVVTQGFIAADPFGRPVSLGREGSDYTAAILANLLGASQVIIWKDVPGILNADPKHFPQTIKLEELSYAEATELAFYGAKVLHPKTVKPLQNKGIPLEVRSFHDPDQHGTLIHAGAMTDRYIPCFIFKFNQALVSISYRDLSFVDERMLYDVSGTLSDQAIHLNMIQNSALTLTICIDDHPELDDILSGLQTRYAVKYNRGLELVTIRHYNERAAEAVLPGREVLLEQQNRTVVQFVVR